MFEAKEVIAQMVEGLIDAVRPLKRGDVLPHETIAEILGVPPHTDHWQLCIRKLKRYVERERGITLWSEPGVGYKLCTIQEQIDTGLTYQVWARRRIRRGIQAIEALPQHGLSLHQQKLRAAYSENLRKSHRELSAQIMTKIPMTTPTLPRRMPVDAARNVG